MPLGDTWNNGRRVLSFAKEHGSSDITVGATSFNNLDFFVREKSPFQKDFDYTKLSTKTKFMEAMGYVGKVVAKSHWTSFFAEAVTEVVRDKESEFKNEIVNFASDYANQVNYDYQSFLDALNRRVPLY